MNRFLWAMAHVGGGLVLLGFTWAAIVYTVPRAEAGEPCKGHMAVASWYGLESCHRTPCRTADGSLFSAADLTAAMPSRSHLGERWRVTYHGQSVVVLVNDIGPRADLHRGIDLSRAAARAIGFDGVHSVCLEKL